MGKPISVTVRRVANGFIVSSDESVHIFRDINEVCYHLKHGDVLFDPTEKLVKDLEFPTSRLARVLFDNNIMTIKELTSLSERGFLSLHGGGRKGLNDLKKVMGGANLSLRSGD